ncbi:hypothetical protein K490DRAFT_52273 [Saccharata proteae CBS 121410]|uniref:Uncharacterized protein n=1 Tax=Saccharata proteae CBS 121410 TaxID=1314787 RepID=A0A9P4HLV3_9PEZI|nr:hypothetical protein K490DRAFT_52273 [Saccharata proteae CBS 121410]
MASPSRDDITALPASHRLPPLGTSPHLRPAHRDYADIPFSFLLNPQIPSRSNTSLPTARERGKLQKRRSNDTAPTRRKSSRRAKKEVDHVREEEIRQMSAPIAVKRPATNSQGMMRRDSKKIRSGFNRRLDRPTSEVSFPTEDSIQSSMSGGSDYRAFKVKSLDVFAPRPTIRLSGSSNYPHSLDRAATESPQHDSRAQKGKVSKNALKESKTIDELADDMDAGTLRELMERDERRRDEKRKQDEERIRRRLQRRSEKQMEKERRREQEAAVAADAELDRMGLGIDIEQGGPVQPAATTEGRGTTNAGTYLDYPPREQIPAYPFAHQERTPSSPVATPVDEPVIGTAQAVRYSQASMSAEHSPAPHHTRGPSNISHVPELASQLAHLTQEVTPTASVPSENTRQSSGDRRRSSELSGGRRTGGWSSFFRRKPSIMKRRSADQSIGGPSEASFSNTSRESMGRQPLPAYLVPQPSRRRSGTPVRTQSKFREELPDAPISPPDSRVQSPEVSGARALTARSSYTGPRDISADSRSSAQLTSLDDAVGKFRTDSPVSPGGRASAASALMSTSLASVDSEGSWLSGKPVKRTSGAAFVRSSFGSGSVNKARTDFNNSYEDLGVPDDEYFRRLTPGPDDYMQIGSHEAVRKPSSNAIGANIDEEPEPTPMEIASPDQAVIQQSVVRQPTVVHRDARVKSREGLLSYFQAGEDSPRKPSTPIDRPESAADEFSSPEATVQRASSVNLSKHHVRHLSAGSARLLDIRSSRGSVDRKRSSGISLISTKEQ